MRLYGCLRGMNKELKPYHHVKLASDVIQDLQMWQVFLQSQEAFCRPFIDFHDFLVASELDWYTDSAKALDKGYGGHHDQAWFYGTWEQSFLTDKDPSIEFLELYAVAVSILL